MTTASPRVSPQGIALRLCQEIALSLPTQEEEKRAVLGRLNGLRLGIAELIQHITWRGIEQGLETAQLDAAEVAQSIIELVPELDPDAKKEALLAALAKLNLDISLLMQRISFYGFCSAAMEATD